MWSRREEGKKEGRAFVKESMEVGFSTSFAGIFILMALSLKVGYPDNILTRDSRGHENVCSDIP